MNYYILFCRYLKLTAFRRMVVATLLVKYVVPVVSAVSNEPVYGEVSDGNAEAISYTKLVPILIKAVQELQAKVEKLEKQKK